MLMRDEGKLFIFCSVLGLLVVSESYIFVPPENTGNEFEFKLIDKNSDPATDENGFLLARDVTNDGFWGLVCDNYSWFTDVAANVICKAMRHGCAEYWNMTDYIDPSSSKYGAVIDKVICEDSRSDFTKCRYNTIGQNDSCDPSKHIYLRCGKDCKFNFELVDIRGESSKRSGLLLAAKDGVKGTVCDDHFDEEAALIICRSMGYDCAASWDKRTNNWKIQKEYEIVLDDVTCSVKGNRNFSESCTWQTENDCSHKEDIHLTCGCLTDEYNFYTIGADRMVNKSGGLLIANLNEDSITICDDGFSEFTANTICKAMNFDCFISWESAGENRTGGWAEVQMDYDIGLTHVNCQEDSSGKTQCYYSVDPYCDHSEDVFLYCGYEYGAECRSPSSPFSRLKTGA